MLCNKKKEIKRIETWRIDNKLSPVINKINKIDPTTIPTELLK